MQSKIDTISQLTHFYNLVKPKLLSYSSEDQILLFGSLCPIATNYNFVEVRPSIIHGNGLFATQDIPEGVIITYYPVQALFESFKTEGSELSYDQISIIPTNPDFKREIEDSNYAAIYACEVEWGNFSRIIGNPKNISNPLLLGHIINCAAGNVFEKIGIVPGYDIKQALREFSFLMKERGNCKRVIDSELRMVPIITTRNVKCGEELLGCYGVRYWYEIAKGVKIETALEEVKKDKEFCAWMCQNASQW